MVLAERSGDLDRLGWPKSSSHEPDSIDRESGCAMPLELGANRIDGRLVKIDFGRIQLQAGFHHQNCFSTIRVDDVFDVDGQSVSVNDHMNLRAGTIAA
ncbi:hypothetical protein RAD16_18885 [Bradyrhizobium sp. 18BD]